MGGRLGEWVSERVGRCARVCVGGQGGVAGRQGRALQISSEFSLFDAWKEFTTAVPDAEVWPSLIPQPIPSSPTRTQPPTATVADRRRGFGIQASRARCLLSVHRLHMAQSFPDDIEVCTATLVRIAPGSSRVDCQELRCLYSICRFPPGQPSRAAAAATQVDLPLYKISNISLVRPKEHAGADDPAEPNGDALEQLLISVEGGSTPELHRYFCRDSHGLATVIVRNLQKWLGKTLEVLEIETRAPAHRSVRLFRAASTARLFASWSTRARDGPHNLCARPFALALAWEAEHAACADRYGLPTTSRHQRRCRTCRATRWCWTRAYYGWSTLAALADRDS